MTEIKLPHFRVSDQGEAVLEDSPIAMPQVYDQPKLVQVCQGRLRHTEAVIAQILRNSYHGVKGAEMQQLSNEFAPLIQWAQSCWDYLLTVKGCRFVPRHSSDRLAIRGDYRAFLEKDFHKLINRVFQEQVLFFAQNPHLEDFHFWIRTQLWSKVVEEYCLLSKPQDDRQRHLTGYSYLRCVPYNFLNPLHNSIVNKALSKLPADEATCIRFYFMHFFTLEALAKNTGKAPQKLHMLLVSGLTHLWTDNPLAYSLIRQIERY